MNINHILVLVSVCAAVAATYLPKPFGIFVLDFPITNVIIVVCGFWIGFYFARLKYFRSYKRKLIYIISVSVGAFVLLAAYSILIEIAHPSSISSIAIGICYIVPLMLIMSVLGFLGNRLSASPKDE